MAETCGAAFPPSCAWRRPAHTIIRLRSLGKDRGRLAEAAAVINGKDPSKAGLVEKDGKTLPMPRRMEGFVTHLADHDWVLSVPAAQWTVDALKQVAVRSYGIKEADLTKKPFNQFRNYVLSQKTAMQLYGAYSTKGWTD